MPDQTAEFQKQFPIGPLVARKMPCGHPFGRSLTMRGRTVYWCDHGDRFTESEGTLMPAPY